MSNQPEQSVERTPSSPEQTLDGAWFRRERERVAIGRKSLATKLGSTESRLHTLEWRRQQVPAEWLPVLRTLEFRIPESAVPEPSVAAVDQVDQAESSVLVVESVAAEATVVEPPVVAEPPVDMEPPIVVEAPAVVEAPSVVEAPTVLETPVIAQAVVEAPPLDAVPSDSQSDLPSGNSSPEPSPQNPSEPLQLYHGRWLRERRYKRAVPFQLLTETLGCTEKEIYALERHDIRLPLRWVSRLLKLGLLSVEESKAVARLPRISQFDGIWLERQRAVLKLSPSELAKQLQASGTDVRLVESRAWLVPSEWLSTLNRLLEERKAARAKTKADSAKLAAKTVSTPAAKTMPVKKTESQPEPKSEAKPEVKANPAKAPIRKTASNEPAAPSASIADTIVEYRVKLGQHIGQSAVEVLGLIAQDLQLAAGKDAFSYDELTAAVKGLFRR